MIFANDHLTFRVLDVLRIDQHAPRRMTNCGRHFCALSYRETTDAVLTAGSQRLVMQPESVTFFPADLDYVREATTDCMTVFHFALYNYAGSADHTLCSVQPSDPQRVAALFRRALTVWNGGAPDRGYRATALLNEVLALLHLDCMQQEAALSPLMQQAVAYIEQNYTCPELTVPQIVAQLHICEAHLRRLFRRELQTSPRQRINDLRLRRAAALLTSGYYTVAEVAAQVGFREEKYFSTLFGRQMGVSPSRYRYRFDGERAE